MGGLNVLVHEVVSTLMVLASEVPLCANVSMGVGVLLVRTGASADPKLQYVALMSVSGGLFSSVNCLIFVIFVIFVIVREDFNVGIPTETRVNSAFTHGDNGGIISPPLTSVISKFSIIEGL